MTVVMMAYKCVMLSHYGGII